MQIKMQQANGITLAEMELAKISGSHLYNLRGRSEYRNSLPARMTMGWRNALAAPERGSSRGKRRFETAWRQLAAFTAT